MRTKRLLRVVVVAALTPMAVGGMSACQESATSGDPDPEPDDRIPVPGQLSSTKLLRPKLIPSKKPSVGDQQIDAMREQALQNFLKPVQPEIAEPKVLREFEINKPFALPKQGFSTVVHGARLLDRNDSQMRRPGVLALQIDIEFIEESGKDARLPVATPAKVINKGGEALSILGVHDHETDAPSQRVVPPKSKRRVHVRYELLPSEIPVKLRLGDGSEVPLNIDFPLSVLDDAHTVAKTAVAKADALQGEGKTADACFLLTRIPRLLPDPSPTRDDIAGKKTAWACP